MQAAVLTSSRKSTACNNDIKHKESNGCVTLFFVITNWSFSTFVYLYTTNAQNCTNRARENWPNTWLCIFILIKYRCMLCSSICAFANAMKKHTKMLDNFWRTSADIKETEKWKELTNPRKDKEAKYTVSEQEWRQPVVAEYLHVVVQRVVTLFLHNKRIAIWSLFTDLKKTINITTCTSTPKVLGIETFWYFSAQVTLRSPRWDFPSAKSMVAQYNAIAYAVKWRL